MARMKKLHPHIKIFALMFALGALISIPTWSSDPGMSRAASAVACPVTDGGAGDGDASNNGTIVINANTTWTTTGYAASDDYWDCTGKTIQVTSNATLTLQGNTSSGYVPELRADNIQVDSGSKISSDGLGCYTASSNVGSGPNESNICENSGQGAGSGDHSNTSNRGTGGGAHGGAGGDGSLKSGGTSYGDATNPYFFGAGGGSAGAGGSPRGGAGGGSFKLNVSSTLTLNGSLTANGADGGTDSSFKASGGGAGGSIHVIAGTIAGSTGTITANGGDGGNNTNGDGGGGGGGRVKLDFTTDSSSFVASLNAAAVASGGSGHELGNDGSVGSLWLPPTPPDTPTISAPSNAATGVSVNPTLSTGTYSGGLDGSTHASSDWKIVASGASCDGTALWSSLDDSTNKTSIVVNTTNGTFASTLAGSSGLALNTTHKLCVRHTSDEPGDSAWASSSFTTGDLSSWSNNKTVRIDNSGGSAITDYTIRIPFNSSNFDFSTAKSDGSDIRVTDSTSTVLLPFYLIEWDSVNDEGGLWVKMPSLPADDTIDIKIYSGNASASSTSSPGTEVFQQFWDHNNYNTWTNGVYQSAFTTLTDDGTYVNVVAPSNGNHYDAGAPVDTSAIDADLITFESRYRLTDVSGNDRLGFMLTDGSASLRASWNYMYHANGNDGVGYYDTNYRNTTQAWDYDEFYEMSAKVDIDGTQDIDYYFFDGNRTLLQSLLNNVDAGGTPTEIDTVRILSLQNYATDADIQYVALRKYMHDEPTVTVLGTAPNTPSISSPSNAATGQGINPVISSSTFSGTDGHTHSSSDWKVVASGSSCDGTALWSATGDTANKTSIHLNATNGAFASTLNGQAGLSYNTTYKICVRYNTSGLATSAWGSSSFTTEDLSNWTSDQSYRISNSNAEILNSYQVRFQLDETNFSFTGVEDDGADIRFTDSTSTYGLPHYIADWDSVNKEAAVWVRVPSIGSESTLDIEMYYGNNSATTIPTTSGDATFVDYFDEGSVNDWMTDIEASNGGGANGNGMTITANGDNLNIQDDSNNTSASSIALNSTVENMSKFTFEGRIKMTKMGNNDNMVITFIDTTMSNRIAQLWAPYFSNQSVIGIYESGNNKTISGTSFEYGSFKEYSIKVKELNPGHDVDYILNNSDGTSFTSALNRSGGIGSPEGPTHVRFATGGNSNYRSNIDVDFLAFREHADAEPTVAVLGSAPTAPSVTSPSDEATGVFTNPTFTFSAYSGDFTHLNTDVKIMASDTCSTGTPVWSATDYTANLTGIEVNSFTGAFGGDLSGKDALKYNETYYACVRYENSVGDSAWSTPSAFTTEALTGYAVSSSATVSNTGSTLTNYQIPFVLNATNFDFDSTETTGSDIRFASGDNTQAYPHYISHYDKAGETALIWVRVDSLTGSGDTTVNLHYGNNTKTTFPGDMGEATFLAFVDEDDLSSIDAGVNSEAAFDSITVSSGALRFQDTSNTTQNAAIPVNGVSSLDDYTVESRIKLADATGTDGIYVSPSDSSWNRNSLILWPHTGDEDALSWHNGSAWQKFADGLFSYDTYFILSQKMMETAGDTDITLYNGTRSNSLATVDQNAPSAGTQSNTTHFYLSTRNSDPNHVADLYLDYVAFRKYAATEPTIELNGGPTVSSLTASQTTDGSDDVNISFTIDSIGDSAQVQAKVEYSVDGGSTWSDPTLKTASSTVTASAGGKPTIDNAQAYQVGKSGGWIDTSGGSVDITLVWDADTDEASSTDVTNMRIRVTGYDNVSEFAGFAVQTSNADLDFVAPTTPANFSADSVTSSSATLSWDATTETNFANYVVEYGTTSGSLGSQWDSDDDASMLTKATTGTTVTSLSGETTYYFRLCAYDDYGHSVCTSEVNTTTGSVPTVATITAVQKTDGTGTVDVSAIFDDTNDDNLRAKIELSLDGGETWTDPTLATSDSLTTASTADVGVDNNATYQLGVSGEYIQTASGANTVAFDLVASNFTDTDVKNARIRITPNDLGGDGSALVSSNFTVDTVDPTAPSNLTQLPSTADVLPLSWDPSEESNFDHYEIWYGQNSTKVTNRNTTDPGGATEHDNDPEDSLLSKIGTNTTTLVNMTESSYYVIICAVDAFGNDACTNVVQFSDNTPPLVGKILPGIPNKTTGKVNVCTTVYDADNPSTMQLGADYTTNSGATWTKMTIASGSITVGSGSTPGLNNAANYQIGTAGNYIPMSSGSNQVCFDWNYREDIGSSFNEIDLRFRPFDGSVQGGAGNGSGQTAPPPKAAFTPTCTYLACSFDGTASSSSSGAIASYAWNFGDTTTGTGSTDTHTYSGAGNYEVTLTVTDKNGKKDTHSITIGPRAESDGGGSDPVIPNLPPTAFFTANCTDLACTFNPTGSGDTDGTISSYQWSFGNGYNSNLTNPTHTFGSAGAYNVRLSVTDNDGAKDVISDTITVTNDSNLKPTVDDNEPPVADIDVTCDGLECSFDGTGSSDSDGSISSYLWNFGDFMGANVAEPTHTFSAAGTYNIRLDVTDNEGLIGTTFTRKTVRVTGAPLTPDQPPVASFTHSCDGLTCDFDASGSTDDGSIETYQWALGDGSLEDDLGTTPSKTYTRGGVYKVTLVVTDDDGLKDVFRQKIRVISDELGGGGGGSGFALDETAPSGLSSLSSPANTSQSLDWNWSPVSEDNFFRYEIWIGKDETKVNNRDISAPNGAIRWDEGYDPNMLKRTSSATQVSGLDEHTVYYVRMWAKDSYENEADIGAAVSQKTNDRADATSGSETKATDGTGKLTFNATFDDLDDVETLTGTYYYNIGEGWQPMTLLTVDADTGEPVVSGNTVGGEDGYIPVNDGENEVSVVWDSKTDEPDADVSDLKIRVIPNDTIENGDPLIIEDVILDNVAPSGLDGGAASFSADLGRAVAEETPKTFLGRVRANSKLAMANVLGLGRAGASVTVSWTPVDDESNWSGIATYWVAYGTSSDSLTSTWDSGDDSALTTMSTSSTTVTGLSTDTTYYFKVYAQDAYGNQSSTSTFSVTTSAEEGGGGGGGGGGNSVNVGSLSTAGDLIDLTPQRDNFEFEYELPGHWSDVYLDEYFQMEDVLEVLEQDDRAIEFAYKMLEDPNQLISRGESVLLMSMLTGLAPDEDYEGPNGTFSDVTDLTDLAAYILYSAEEGRVNGHEDGSFKPTGTTSRVEILKFIGEFLGTEFDDSKETFILLNKFPDVNPSAWYSKYLDYAYRNEVVGGYQDGTYRPSNSVTMGEALKMAIESYELQ